MMMMMMRRIYHCPIPAAASKTSKAKIMVKAKNVIIIQCWMWKHLHVIWQPMPNIMIDPYPSQQKDGSISFVKYIQHSYRGKIEELLVLPYIVLVRNPYDMGNVG